MNSRERVQFALNHREADRVPLDLGVAQASRFIKQAYLRITEAMGIEDKNVRLLSKLAQQAYPADEFLKKLEVDFRSPFPDMVKNAIDEWEDVYGFYAKDEWNITYKMPKAEGYYYDMIEHPLGEKDVGIDETYSWPRVPGIKTNAVEDAKRYKADGYTVIFPYHFGNGFFQMGAALYGFENWLMIMALEKQRVQKFFHKLLDLKMKYWDVIFEYFGDTLDIVGEADDLGTQSGLLISPDMYREMIKPIWKKLFQYIKKKSKAKIFFHSCGSIVKLIPDFIEIGVDILNPIQVNTEGMDPVILKKEFGDSIVFWGGGIDTQGVLPNGTPQQVRDEVKRRIDDLAPGGGFIFSPTHNIQPDVPEANFTAMWEAFMEYRNY